MKKLLLSLLVVAGAWTSAGAQTAIEGYKLSTSDFSVDLPLTSDKISDNKYSFTDTNAIEFGLSSKSLSYTDKDIIVYVFKKNSLSPWDKSEEEGNVTFSWKKTGNYYVTVRNVAITTRSYMESSCTVDIDGMNATDIKYGGITETDNQPKQNKSVSWELNKTSQISAGNSVGSLLINYKKNGRTGVFPEVGNTYIGSFKVSYTISSYTLNFDKADALMSQAEVLYNGLSAESKASTEGQALLNAKNTTADFKAAYENEVVDVKAGTLRAELTADENAMQAAIDAFTCNLADTDEQYTVKNKTVTNVTLTRTIKAGTWNTLCLPFDMEIPEGWTVKQLSGVTYTSETNSYDAQFTAASSIVAGKPYIVKVEDAVTEIIRNDDAGFHLAETPQPDEASDNGGTLYFTGVFAPVADIAGCYFISGGKFYYAAEGKGNSTKGYRALFTTTTGRSSSAQLIYTVDEGALTLIDAPELIGNDAAPVFDMQGRRVNNPVSGQLYMKNGKKFIQK